LLTGRYQRRTAGKLAMVVTHILRCARPSALPDVPPRWGLTLALADTTLDWYLNIFRRVGKDGLWFERLTKTDAECRRYLSDAGHAVFHADENGRRGAGSEEGGLKVRLDGTCELAYFGLDARR